MPLIRNYMEDCVAMLLDKVINEVDVCKCENCRYDITAIALNSLPPKYVVTTRGQFYAKMDFLHQQFDVDIISAITRATTLVAKNPRHGDNDSYDE